MPSIPIISRLKLKIRIKKINAISLSYTIVFHQRIPKYICNTLFYILYITKIYSFVECVLYVSTLLIFGLIIETKTKYICLILNSI